MEKTEELIPQRSVEQKPDSIEVATLGGGCFWCLEAVYQEMKGVLKVESGYAGGHIPNPTYRQVCTGTTGHAEVVQITYDPSVVSYAELLEVFFTIHDPTTLNRQGNDVGPQYRSIILYHNPEQKRIAQEAKKAAAKLWPKPIVTEIVPLERFYKAEDYHQNYYRNNPAQPYCIYVVGPKVEKFRQKFRDYLKQ
ncbi:MAG: peptide-methionine (S)-S-oxide reductase MsrA [Saprospiraceae bacterium]|nr:peptide-methionine (S)-S-oxide reductase MsrA [Saprospiraceae bacterium]MDW8483178.1 peptide-methionine (S)-S-oxide reductase MsrA [Saprospiraceae bacterium]